jgi:hypothetical protein
MKLTKLQIILPLIGMFVTYGLLWIGGFSFDHRGIDTMLLLMLILSVGSMAFIVAKGMEIE